MAGDSYTFETGLADDFGMEIQNPYFQFSPKLARGGEPQLALHLEGKAEGGSFEEPTQLADETALLFSVGKGWLITDDGQKLVHESGSVNRRFNQSTAIARLLKSAMDAGVPLKDRGEAFEAKIWTGLRLHFKRQMVDFGEGIGPKPVLMVEKYLGTAESGKATSGARPAAATSAATDTAKALAGDDATLISDAVGGAVFKRLVKVATTAEDYETFAAEASELPKIKDDDGLQEIILDEERGAALWEQLKG